MIRSSGSLGYFGLVSFFALSLLPPPALFQLPQSPHPPYFPPQSPQSPPGMSISIVSPLTVYVPSESYVLRSHRVVVFTFPSSANVRAVLPQPLPLTNVQVPMSRF